MNDDLNHIKKIVESYFKIKLNQKSRVRSVVLARNYYYMFARQYTAKTTKQIGKLVNRDHATVLHGTKAIKELIEIYPKFREHAKNINSNFDIIYFEDLNTLGKYIAIKNRIKSLKKQKKQLKQLLKNETK